VQRLQQRAKPLRQPPKLTQNKTWLVVGLGNPGPGYQANRHNVGQMTLDVLASRLGVQFRTHKSVAVIAKTKASGGEDLILAKSAGFMNQSGAPVSQLAKYFSVPTENIIVVHDELDIEFGDIRSKFDGGHAGHNGLRDISAKCGTNYHRVRFGIGRPPGQMAVSDFVLQNFATVERKEVPVLLELAADRVMEVLASDSK